ncbi:MAG TPA: protein-methionine-sulfoxide reductase catalytic subunit MsrP [Burkholderiales bacterium]|nr:protein-methionine-sulfoxide reductase catalytic subunit MsrP [Burkholderiales bacterium]
MLIRPPSDIKPSEITDHASFLGRRDFLRAATGLGVAGGLYGAGLWMPGDAQAATKLAGVRKSTYSISETLTPLDAITSYNNYYEFGTDKADPAANAGKLKTRPWQVGIEGEVKKPRVYDIEELQKLAPLEERVYRMRCVEGWSMVIPWVGFPLAELIKRVEPTGNAKFVEFVTLLDPAQMPGQSVRVLQWPYVEGLRMDEAMHPLTLLTLGLYGEMLPNQNGAPVRVVVPWKYGFKSAKAIVKIRFTERQPKTSWELAGPSEYGFYSNVNPHVDHPRWSQAKERRIEKTSVLESLFEKKRDTLMFNGYGDQVAQLYAGMDLKKNF